MVSANEINTHFVIYEVFDGDIFAALNTARENNRITLTFTPKSIERALILQYIKLGWSDKAISEAMSSEEYKVLIKRVSRLRREIKSGKRKV